MKGTLRQKCFCVHSVQNRVTRPRKCLSPVKNENIKVPVAITDVQVGWQLPNHEAKHQPVCFQKRPWCGGCLSSSLFSFVLEFVSKNFGSNALRFNSVFFLIFTTSLRGSLCLTHNARRSNEELKWVSSWQQLPDLHGEICLSTGHSTQ